jgi:hypothetical protein
MVLDSFIGVLEGLR